MKNKEKFAKEILEIACNGDSIAVKNNKLECCRCIDCSNCLFNCSYDCREQVRKWAESEYIENSVISKRDRSFLDYINNNFVYVARDKSGRLFAYEAQPRKGNTYWKHNRGNCLLLNRQLNIDFPMIKWEDNEPWLIEDLKKLEVVEEYN